MEFTFQKQTGFPTKYPDMYLSSSALQKKSSKNKMLRRGLERELHEKKACLYKSENVSSDPQNPRSKLVGWHTSVTSAAGAGQGDH